MQNIDSAYINIKTVSGKASINKLIANDAVLGTVSGAIKSNYIKADNLRLESISGQIIIDNAHATINATTISGNILVNGNEFGNNIKNKVRDFFK